MKKFSCIIVYVFILLCVCSCTTQIDSNKIDGERYNKTIIVGGIDDMEPYSYINSRGKYTGFNVEVMSLIAEELNINIVYRKIDIENVSKELESQNIDMALGAQYGVGSFDEFMYTKPFIKNYFNIYVDNSTNNIRSLDDLEKKTVSVYRWDPAYQRVKNIKNIRLYVCNNQSEAFEFLKNGMADAYVANSSLAFNYIEEPLYNRKIKIVGGKIDALPSGVVALKENKKLIEFINIGIERVKENKKIDVLYEKWFGSKIAEKQALLYRIIYSAIIMGFILLIILAIIYRINKILKKQVNEKTLDIKKEIELKKEIINSISDLLVTIDKEYIITTLNNKIDVLETNNEIMSIYQDIKNTCIMNIIKIEELECIINGKDEKIHGEKKLNINESDNYFEYNITRIIYNGEIFGATIIIKDITNRVLMKNRLIMEDKMKTIGHLSAGIAHEIRNPLTSIDVYINLLPQRIDNLEFREQIIKDLPLEVKRINNIVEDLLNYAKPNFPETISFSVLDEIEDIIRLRRKNKDLNDIIIDINICDNLYILFDKNNFRQIIINLLSNSIDAVKNTNNPKVSIYSIDYGKICGIVVEDNGVGIDNKNFENIFEPLFTNKKRGNGLGLAIVSQLIKENNSTINLYSKINEGTKFEIKVMKG